MVAVELAESTGVAQGSAEFHPQRRANEANAKPSAPRRRGCRFVPEDHERITLHERRVQQYLHPFSEHLIEWFHITMKLTVLQQQIKGGKRSGPRRAPMYPSAWKA
jgi:hypothetical protein